jgi:hypothetical protein
MLFKDDAARVPFSIIGILMILMSTVVSAYLMKMEFSEISMSLDDERYVDVNEAISFARSDIDICLNYAGMYAESEVGRRPVLKLSEKSDYYGSLENINIDRIKKLTYDRLSKYLDTNYNEGSFIYGDYAISAEPINGYRAVKVAPFNMTLKRIVDSPIIPCEKEYESYYLITVPVRINVKKTGSELNYWEDYEAKAFVTSRYPLLKELTGEYENRLNSTALMFDVTGTAFAYTLVRGFSQYATTEPMNIVDNSHLEQIANGGSLLEQGFVFNSVDPMSLASLTIKASGRDQKTPLQSANKDKYGHVNPYNISENSKITVNSEKSENINLSFNADSIVEKELSNMYRGSKIKNIVDSSYSCEMHIVIYRKPASNNDGSIVKELLSTSYYPDTSYPVMARETWSYNNGVNNEIVTLEYIVDQISLYGNGNDISSPFKPYRLNGHNDTNLMAAVDSYKDAIGFRSRSDEIISDHLQFPDSSSILKRVFTVKRGTWVEHEAMDMLNGLSDDIKNDIRVNISSSGFESPQSLVMKASEKMEQIFNSNYEIYLSEDMYLESGVYRSCGTKSLYQIKLSFLESIRKELNGSAAMSSALINGTMDKEIKKYNNNLNSSSITDNSGSSKNFLENNLYIPFGLSMNLSSINGTDSGYFWSEKISVAVDQRPDYLGTGFYRDNATGYASYPLKVRNVCLFSLPSSLSGDAGKSTLEGLSSILDASDDINNETVSTGSKKLASNIRRDAKSYMIIEIENALLTDIELNGAITEKDIKESVNGAFLYMTDDVAVRSLRSGSIQREVSSTLAKAAKTEALKKDTGAIEFAGYIEEKVRIVTLDACDIAVTKALEKNKKDIEDNFKGFMKEGEKNLKKESVKAALKSIPMGLPLLPPYGYWATLNVWYIEIDGNIPVFTLYDADMEPVPDPFFGHQATSYTRRIDIGIDDGYGIIGNNEPIKFHVNTSTFVIVPPGKSGVGDRIGGWDEKSEGFA